MPHITKKQLLLLIMVISVVIFICIVSFMLKANDPLSAYEQSGQLLSELSESECQEFVLSKGVEISRAFDLDKNPELIKELICQAEQAPQSQCGHSSYTEIVFLAESIRKVVNEYYGITILDDDGAYMLDDT